MVAVLFPMVLKAQVSNVRINIKAYVYSTDKKPIAGAVINNTENENEQAVTDENGLFTISVAFNTELSVTAKGYKIKYIAAKNELTEIILTSENEGEEVPVAFRKVNRNDLFNDVSYVDVSQLLSKNYSTYSLDNMEVFASGFHGNLWGMDNYLTLIDGVPRDAGTVLPTEIDKITFLKGVNAIALYGSRAAKGVVLITTKRGQANNNRVDVRANTGVNVPKRYPGYLGSAEYMTLYNEARANDGLSKLYDDATIYNHASGKNPYRYPSVDFYSSEYLKKMYTRYDVTTEISGGNDRARYYTNMGYTTSGSLLNFGEAIKNDNSSRFNVRGNVDMNINKYITSTVDANVIFYTGAGVNTDYWGSAATSRPNRYSPLIPIGMIEGNDSSSLLYVKNSNYVIDGKYLLGGTQLDQTNPFAAIYAGGSNRYNSRQFQFKTGVGADLRNLLEGLKFQTNIAVDYASSYTLSFNNTYATYQPTWNTYSGKDLVSSLTKYSQDAKSGVQNSSNSWYRQTIAFSANFSYSNTFKRNHNVTGMLLANGYRQSESAVYQKIMNSNLGLQTGYNYKGKYYADFSGAFMYSAKVPEKNRFVFSPTLSLAWRLSKEKFMAKAKAVDDLKLTVSGGILHTDLTITDYYMYQGYYTVAGSWFGWKDGTGIQATESRRGDNPNLSFPERKEINAGFEGSFFKNVLHVNGSVFYSKITNNIVGGATLANVMFPSYFYTYWPVSSFVPFINYNSDERRGFDFGVNVNKRAAGIDWNLGITGSYYTTKAIKRAEVYANSYQLRQGKPLDAIWGLQNLGFFKDANDISSSPKQSFGDVKPGDIKYKDQNNDGIIDTQDEVFLGKGGWYGAPLTLGLQLTAKWKSLTFFAMGVGRFGSYGMKNNSYFWVDGEDKYSVVVRNRWTEATKETATYPRLTTNTSDNNFRSSDFWMYKTNRFDLNRVQISYDLSSILKQKSFVREFGVYVSGTSLLTISSEREIMELNIGSTPQNRYYNLGVKALF